MTVRDIRNNNPGNIRRSNDKWQGLCEKQTDPEFFQFKTPEWGIRAIARILIEYQDEYNINTIAGIISKWAPSNENNTESYIANVCRDSGFSKDMPLNIHEYADIQPVIKSIIHEESGGHPYSDVTINRGLALAGIEPPKEPILKSKTIAGTVAVTLGTLTKLADPIQQTKDDLSPYIDTSWVYDVSLTLTVLGIIITLYAYFSDRKKRLT